MKRIHNILLTSILLAGCGCGKKSIAMFGGLDNAVGSAENIAGSVANTATSTANSMANQAYSTANQPFNTQQPANGLQPQQQPAFQAPATRFNSPGYNTGVGRTSAW